MKPHKMNMILSNDDELVVYELLNSIYKHELNCSIGIGIFFLFDKWNMLIRIDVLN